MSYDRIAEQLKNPSIKLDKLVQYAQGTNPLIPEFLALGEIKRRETLNQHTAPAPVPQTTVAQDLATKAMAPQMPMQQMPQPPQQGIAGIPPQAPPQALAALPSGMNQQSFAGGGIVAFSGDKKSDVEDPYDALSFTEKLKRLRAAEDEDTAPQSSLFNRGIPMIGSFEKNISAYQPKNKNAVYGRTQDQEDMEGPAAVPKGMDPTKQVAPPKESGSSKPRPSARDVAKELNIPQTTTPKEDMFGKYEKMFNAQAAEAKAGREQDKWMRMLEAGLGIMGGTSPHAMVNIGQGATAAAKGYAQDVAAGRKEDRQNVMDLMGLGLKREEAEREARKLAMTEKLYGSHGRYYEAAADAAGQRAAGAGTAANTRMTIAQQNLVHKYFQDLKKDINNYGVADDVLMQKAMGMAGVSGGNGVNAAAQAPMGSWTPQGGFKPFSS